MYQKVKRIKNKHSLNKGPEKITAERAVLTSAFVSIFDVVGNLIASIMTGSIVMLAEMFHGCADFVSAIFIYIGLKRSKKPSDKKHPFGYGKSLYIWTFISTLIMVTFTSGIVFYSGLRRFLYPEEIKNIYIAYIILGFFVISNSYSLSLQIKRIIGGRDPKKFFVYYKESEKIGTKTTFVLDLMGVCSSLIGIIALFLYKSTGNLKFDGLGAMAISLVLVSLSIYLLTNTNEFLIGKRASVETEKKIKKLIRSVIGVKDILDFKTLNIGRGKILVNVEVHVKQNLNTKKIERLMDEIKEKVLNEVRDVHHIQIEIETPNKKIKKKKSREKINS